MHYYKHFDRRQVTSQTGQPERRRCLKPAALFKILKGLFGSFNRNDPRGQPGRGQRRRVDRQHQTVAAGTNAKGNTR